VPAVGDGVVSVAAGGGTVGAVVVSGGTVNVKQVLSSRIPSVVMTYVGAVEIMSTNQVYGMHPTSSPSVLIDTKCSNELFSRSYR